MHARTIRLRRPVTLSLLEEPFVPKGAQGLLSEVDRRWGALREANPAYHDGRLLHVLGAHRNGHGGAVLHVADCAYRFHAVQQDDFDLGVRPLGVKGITTHGDRVLLGKRSPHVNAYRGMWEFAPGGVVEPGDEPAATIRRELMEETSLDCLGEPVALAVIFDPVARTWEIVYRLAARNETHAACTAEYDELRWCEPGDVPMERDLTPITRQMADLLTG